MEKNVLNGRKSNKSLAYNIILQDIQKNKIDYIINNKMKNFKISELKKIIECPNN